MMKFAIGFSVLLVLSIGAWAGDPKGGDLGGKIDGKGEGKDPLGETRAIAFDELKARCEHPEEFDVQRAPQNIRILCTDVSREFVAASPGEIALAGGRIVQTSVYSDKFHVNQDEHELPVYIKSGSCLRFKEVEKVLALERHLGCAEILGWKGDLASFCVAGLDAAKVANPKLLEVKDTGRLVDTCPADATDHRDKGDGKGDGK
ncbi:hypothetical protein WDW86_01665 [Bdellovibrionota bacterium FG-2]